MRDASVHRRHSTSVRRCARSDPFRVRRMAERKLRRGGDREPTPQSAAQPAVRDGDRGGDLRARRTWSTCARVGSRGLGGSDHARVEGSRDDVRQRLRWIRHRRDRASSRSAFSIWRFWRPRVCITRWPPMASNTLNEYMQKNHGVSPWTPRWRPGHGPFSSRRRKPGWPRSIGPVCRRGRAHPRRRRSPQRGARA